ncbi:hypothetical protein IAG41_13115 [Sphingomonas sp. JC676]|uniref:hypothetical protein n=1 Tax=Sphingomonas sp. JC676 TaxID=2768065 RepID=UPI001657B5F5|nr:hypothetical protein [Sphingomonas sp. JC676]MBC9033330.1 hypothetical protein [Sphingomonas sp. JC676]
MTEALRARIAASREASRAIARRWLEGAEYRTLENMFADCPLESAEPAADRAERLLSDSGWATALIDPLVAALDHDPFFEPPFKISRDARRFGAVLFDCPAISITMSIASATAMATLPAPASMVFTGRMAVTRYLKAGGATLRRWRAEPITARFGAATAVPARALPPVTLVDGDMMRLDGRIEAQLVAEARSDVVTLAATVRPGAAPLMREYAIPDGVLIRTASNDDRASRTEMLLAFLRLSGRADAGEQFGAVTRDPAFHVRWAAMREWLALDARAALPRLAEMATGDANMEVRAAATLTLVAVERRLEQARCLA